MWPPSSPDLNSLDYGVLGAIEQKAYANPYRNVDSLKAAVKQEWALMSEDFLKRTCRAIRPRIEAMLAVKGGHLKNKGPHDRSIDPKNLSFVSLYIFV